jgi:AraC-like DNA-binding protein
MKSDNTAMPWPAADQTQTNPPQVQGLGKDPMPSRLDTVSDWKARARRAQYDPVNLANGCRVSLRRLEQHFRAWRRMTPRAWLSRLKLKDALKKIRRGFQPKAISDAFGFSDPTHFYRALRREFGCPFRQLLAQSRQIRR